MKNRVWAIVMVFVLLLTNFQGASYVFAQDMISVGYSFEQTYDEESNTVVIKGNGSDVPNNVQITSIKADDGTELNLEDPKYTAKENKEYSFLISYLVFTQDGENISSDAREETKTVSVTEIKDKAEENVTDENITEENITDDEVTNDSFDDKGNTNDEKNEQVTTFSDQKLILTPDSPKEKEIYNLGLKLTINSVTSDKYQVKLVFPKNVKIAENFDYSKLESISGITREENENENISIITFNNKVMIGNNTHIEVAVPIDQKDYLSAVKSTEYEMKGIYLINDREADEVAMTVESGTYRKISSIEYVATDNLFVGEWQVNKLKVNLDSKLDLNKIEDSSQLILSKDSNLEYNIADSSFTDQGNNIVTTIKKENIQGNKGNYFVELPINIKINDGYLIDAYRNLKNKISSSSGSNTLSYDFETELLYLNIEKERLSSKIKFAGIVLESNTSDYVFSNDTKEFNFDFDKIQKESSLNLFDKNLYSVNVIESWTKESAYYRFSNSKNINGLKDNLKVQLEVTLPNNVDWKGNKEYYDEKSRKVTINITNYEEINYSDCSVLQFGKLSAMNLVVNHLSIDGSEDGQIAAEIPYKIMGTYKDIKLSEETSNILVKSNKLGANLSVLESNPEEVERNKKGQTVVLKGKFDSFKMNYDGKVKLSFEIDDKFADLKEIKLNTAYSSYIDSQFGEEWIIEYTEKNETMEREENISRNDFISNGISTEDGRITKISISSNRFKQRNIPFVTNMFDLKFNVLSANRYTGEVIVDGNKIQITPYSEFNDIKKAFNNCYINIIEDKIRASIDIFRMYGNNGNERDVLVENTTSILGYNLFLQNYQNLTDEDGKIENQSITLNFSSFDKFKVKKFALSKDYENGKEQIIGVKYSTNLNNYSSTITFKADTEQGQFSDQKLSVKDPDKEYITSITLTSDIVKASRDSMWYFLNKISFETDILDTDSVTLKTLPQTFDFFSVKEDKSDYLNVSSSVQSMKVVSQEIEYYYGSGLQKSSFDTILSKESIIRGGSFTVSQDLNLYSQWTYGRLKGIVKDVIYPYHDTYSHVGIDENKLLNPYQNANGYEFCRTLDKDFLKYSVVNPIIYIPLADGFDYVEKSFKIKNEKYSNKKPDISIVIDENNQKYIKIQFYGNKDDVTSLYIDDFTTKDHSDVGYSAVQEWLSMLKIEYDLSTSVITPLGSTDIASSSKKVYVDFITGYESYAKTILGNDSTISKNLSDSIAEKKNFDSELLPYVFAETSKKANILVSGESVVSLDTLIKKDNSYKTKLDLLSGESFDLISAIANGTLSNTVKDSYIYVPIKKTDSNGYRFNFELTGAANVNASKADIITSVSYSTKSNPSMNYTSAESEYSSSVSKWADVTCVKIRVQNLTPSTQVVVSIPVTNEEKVDICAFRNL